MVAFCNLFFTSLFLQRSSPSRARDCFQRTANLSNIIFCLLVPKKMPPQCSSAVENTHQLGSWSPLGTQTGLHTPAPALKTPTFVLNESALGPHDGLAPTNLNWRWMCATCSEESSGMYFGVCRQAERECWSDHTSGVTPRDAKRRRWQSEEWLKSLGTAS